MEDPTMTLWGAFSFIIVLYIICFIVQSIKNKKIIKEQDKYISLMEITLKNIIYSINKTDDDNLKEKIKDDIFYKELSKKINIDIK